jgi:hypothetical protein
MLALADSDWALAEAGIEGGPVAWLHDEIVLEVPEEYDEEAARLLKREMVKAFEYIFRGAPVNGLVEPHIGKTWAEAKAGAKPAEPPAAEPKVVEFKALGGRHRAVPWRGCTTRSCWRCRAPMLRRPRTC